MQGCLKLPKVPQAHVEERTEAAAYIATLTGELAAMARRSGLSTLGYLLEMAKLEAEQSARSDSIDPAT